MKTKLLFLFLLPLIISSCGKPSSELTDSTIYLSDLEFRVLVENYLSKTIEINAVKIEQKIIDIVDDEIITRSIETYVNLDEEYLYKYIKIEDENSMLLSERKSWTLKNEEVYYNIEEDLVSGSLIKEQLSETEIESFIVELSAEADNVISYNEDILNDILITFDDEQTIFKSIIQKDDEIFEVDIQTSYMFNEENNDVDVNFTLNEGVFSHFIQNSSSNETLSTTFNEFGIEIEGEIYNFPIM